MKNTLISLILCAFIFSSCSYGKSIGLYRKGLKKAEMEQYHEAIEIFNETRNEYLSYFKENPDAVLKNLVFGELNKYEWYLLERKHLNHHFNQFDVL